MKLVVYSDYNKVTKKIVELDKPEDDHKISICGSNRLNEYIKDTKIEEVNIGCSGKKVYRIKKKSKTFYLKIADHLSKESMKLEYLFNKINCPEKVFYEKYNGKSYLLTKSVEGEMLCVKHYEDNPLEGIDIVVEAFNALYNIDYMDCMFDETIDVVLKEIEDTLNDKPITNKIYFDRFHDRQNMLRYLKGNKPKQVIGFVHGEMSLPNIFAKNGHFSGLVDVDKCGISDIYYDIVTCEKSIEMNYGKEYIDIFYSKLGIEKDEFKSDYYRIMIEI